MKKIVIFSSQGGGGHVAVASALEEFLKTEYAVETTNIFTQVFAPLDFLRMFTRGYFYAEDIYNYCLAKKWYRFLNRFYKTGVNYYTFFGPTTKRLLHAYLDKKKPDLIISVIPLVNNFILDVARERNIPFLLIPTDLDISTFIVNIEHPSYDKFKVALAFDDSTMKKKLAQASFPTHTAEITGFLLRSTFYASKNKQELKRTYQIPENKPVILLMLGAVGSSALYDFAQQLAQLPENVHLIICTGQQKNIIKRLQEIPFPSHITTTIIGFTSHVADLMAMADLLITKSGSVSFNESLYMNLPMILDATSGCLRWEAYNHDFIKAHQFGSSLKELSSLTSTVCDLLVNSSQLEQYKKNLEAFEKKQADREIKNIITQMLAL